MSKLNIFLAHNFYRQRGGEASVFQNERELLASGGHQVVCYTRDNLEINNSGIFNRLISPLWFTYNNDTTKQVASIVSKKCFDVAHIHNTFPLISPSLYYVLKDFNIPIIQTLHNFRLMCPSATFYRNGNICEDCMGKLVAYPGIRYKCWQESYAKTACVTGALTFHKLASTFTNKVDIFIALTDFARKKFVEGGIPDNKVVVKPNFSPDFGFQNKQQGKYFLFVGRLSEEKGLYTLLQAWEKLPTNCVLKIVGDGLLHNKVSELAEQFNNIEYLGKLSKELVIEVMRDAISLVFPSEWYEGFPMVIAEAFSVGLPVITSKLGSMSTLIEHGYTGLHFEPGSVESLKNKIQWANANQSKMLEMAKNARHVYECNYTPQKNYSQIMRIYDLVSDKV